MATLNRTDSMSSNASRRSVWSILSFAPKKNDQKNDQPWEPVVVYEALDKKMYLEDRSKVKSKWGLQHWTLILAETYPNSLKGTVLTEYRIEERY
jgi:hypothetical protein